MNKLEIENKKAQAQLLAIISISVLLLIISIVLVSGALQSSIEQTGDIEIFADTSMSLDIYQNNVRALLTLDNKTILSGQEIELYLDDSLTEKQKTDSEGYVILNLSNTSQGIYSFKAIFSGSSLDYFNPSFAEKQIQIIEQNGSREIRMIKQNETNFAENITLTISNQTLLTINTDKKMYIKNETMNIFGELTVNGEAIDTIAKLQIIFNETSVFASDINILNGTYSYQLVADFEKEGNYLIRILAENLSTETNFYFVNNDSLLYLGNMICKEFHEYVLWSSGFTILKDSSAKYQTWYPEHNCSEIGKQNCIITNIKLDSRLVSSPPDEENGKEGKGFVQISDLSNCDEPENAVYSEYLMEDKLGGENVKKDKYCGNGENIECEKNSFPVMDYSSCYGIKSRSSQYLLLDTFSVDYTICGGFE